VELLWKPPHGKLETVPQAQVMPQEIATNMIVKTALPADDRSDGYERGTTISKEWDQATTTAALEVAAHVDFLHPQLQMLLQFHVSTGAFLAILLELVVPATLFAAVVPGSATAQ
jgi:hypothetical protein